MAETLLQKEIRSYDQWKQGLIEAIRHLDDWLNTQDISENGEHSLRIYEAIEALQKDRLNIAFVAEFSRGKTELINAIFFADYQRRLLPSEAGRTTMCPTELFYDRESNQAYIRLLPIETRLEERSITEYKGEPIHWTTIPLDINDPDQMEKALKEVVRTKEVKVEQAKRLGLFGEEMLPNRHGELPDKVEIPMWRHALISFPHPLLQQGLVVLDTPGLNAIGTEPELTMNMLPSAHAILFILAADTGVTKSDLDIWQFHVDGARRARQKKGVAVVLNKIDTLWDELKGEQGFENSLNSQIKKTANILGVTSNHIFPVSAQKGLLGKVRNDTELQRRSRLFELERFMCHEVLPGREAILRESLVSELGQLVDEKAAVLKTRHDNIEKQLKELRALSGKNADVILHLMKKTREEQTTYTKNVESFQASRRLLLRQGKAMMDSLSLESMDEILDKTRKAMSGSWTTVGLKKGMTTFFTELGQKMEAVNDNAEQARKLIIAIYKKFHEEHGLTKVNPRIFTMKKYNEQMEMLMHEAEVFRKSPITTMTEQSFVVKKFFIHLASQARNLFFKANQEADTWLKDVMNPLVAQIKEHKQLMERRLKTLRKINESRDTLDAKIGELQDNETAVAEQLQSLLEIRKRIEAPTPYQHTAKSSGMASSNSVA